MLLEEIDVLSRVHVCPVDLALISRRIRERDQLDGLDNHNYLLV
jgi:hypothetical protein